MADDSPFMTDAALFGAPPPPYPKGIERVNTDRIAPTAEVTSGTATFEFNVPAGEGLIDLLNTSVELRLAVEDANPANAGHDLGPEWGKEVSIDPMMPDALFSKIEITLNGRAMDDATDADQPYAAAARRMLLGEPGDLDFEAASFLGAPLGGVPGNGIGAAGDAVAIDYTPSGLGGTAIANVATFVAFCGDHLFGRSTDNVAHWNANLTLLNGYAYRLLQHLNPTLAAKWLAPAGGALWRHRFDIDGITAPANLTNDETGKFFNQCMARGFVSLIELISSQNGFPQITPETMLFSTTFDPTGLLTAPTADPLANTTEMAAALAEMETYFNDLATRMLLNKHFTSTEGVRYGATALIGRGATTACGIPHTGMLPTPAATMAGGAHGALPVCTIGGAGGINHSAPGASANQVARNSSAWYHGTGGAGSKIPLVVDYRPQHVLWSGGRHSRYLPAGTNMKLRFTLSRQVARLFRKAASDGTQPRIGFAASSVAPGFQPVLLVTRVYPTNSMRAALALSLEKAGHRLLLTRCRAQSFDLATSAASSASTTRTGLVSGSKPARIVIFAVPAAAYEGDAALSWLGCGRAARLAYYDDTAAGYAQHAPVGTVTHCRVIWGGTPCPWVLDQTSQQDEALPEAYAEYRRACEGSGPVLSYGQYLNCMPLVFTPAQAYPAGGPGGYTHEASDVSSHSSAQVDIEVGPIGYGTAPPGGRSAAYKIVVVALESAEVTCDASKTYSRSW